MINVICVYCGMFSPPHFCVQFYFSIITMTLLSPLLSPSPSSTSHHLLFFSTNILSSFHCLSIAPSFTANRSVIPPSLHFSLPRLLSLTLQVISLFLTLSIALFLYGVSYELQYHVSRMSSLPSVADWLCLVLLTEINARPMWDHTPSHGHTLSCVYIDRNTHTNSKT